MPFTQNYIYSRKHKESLIRGNCHNILLQRSWNKYGEDNFKFETLILCSPKDLTFYEDRVIKGYKANDRKFGFNLRIAADSNLGMDRGVYRAGDKYNSLTLIEPRSYNKHNELMWLCKCDCGVEKEINVGAVKRGKTKSCGCAFNNMMIKRRDVNRGSKHNMLTMISPSHKDRLGNVLWKCKCDCGNETNQRMRSVLSGNSKSCGCIKSETGRKNIKVCLEKRGF